MVESNNNNNNNKTISKSNFSEELNDFKKDYEKASSKILEKDLEIQKLKQELENSKKLFNKKVDVDIKSKTNRNGDVARVCIGTTSSGQRMWKKATDLTDADIKRRELYINSIRQMNAKKND